MMWIDTFNNLARKSYSLESFMLQNRIPLVTKGGDFITSSPIERTSAVMAARLPLNLNTEEKRRLIFLMPNATQHLGRFLAVGLLLSDFVHRVDHRIPHNEKGRLIHGDILLITQHIRECISLLREISVFDGSKSLSLVNYWPIEVLSQYSPPLDDKPRVFVANPGWLGSNDFQRRFYTVIVDASHPRTMDHLGNLLQHPSIESSTIQLIVLPPCEPERIERLHKDERLTNYTWAWDPAASAALDSLFSSSTPTSQKNPLYRYIWICNDDQIGNIFAELHELLVGAMKLSNGKAPGRLLEAWSVYHRLRQLVVPLVMVEEESHHSFKKLTIGERIKVLEDEPLNCSGTLSTYLDSRWPKIIKLLKSAYSTLLENKEPAKFYTLASALDEQLKHMDSEDSINPIRIVVPTVNEGNILTLLLSDVIDGWSNALQMGKVLITTVREEPRLIAEGQRFPSVLLGFRTSDTRYLDIYPGVPIHLIAYPYEVVIDKAIQKRIHTPMEHLQDNQNRTGILKALGLPVPRDNYSSQWTNKFFSLRPEIIIRNESIKICDSKKRIFIENTVEPLDIEKLAGLTWTDEVFIETSFMEPSKTAKDHHKLIEFMEITVSTGERFRFPATRLIDVFYPKIERKERVVAANLQPGMLIIMLVDDPYENLFERLIEVITNQRDIRSTMVLELWRSAKQKALIGAGGSRQSLYNLLSEQGLSVDYAAVVGWYSLGEEEIIAPLKYDDFAILAKASGLYTDIKLLETTFVCIKRERALRRLYGKRLSKLLSLIAAGQNYEIALQSSKILDTPLEQIAAAVSLKQIEAVRNLGTVSNI